MRMQLAGFVDLGTDLQKRTTSLKILSLSSAQHHPLATLVKEKMQKTTPEIMRSCGFTLSSVSGYFNLEEALTRQWALCPFCLWGLMFLILCQPHTLLL